MANQVAIAAQAIALPPAQLQLSGAPAAHAPLDEVWVIQRRNSTLASIQARTGSYPPFLPRAAGYTDAVLRVTENSSLSWAQKRTRIEGLERAADTAHQVAKSAGKRARTAAKAKQEKRAKRARGPTGSPAHVKGGGRGQPTPSPPPSPSSVGAQAF
jgi:hypothetical protein